MIKVEVSDISSIFRVEEWRGILVWHRSHWSRRPYPQLTQESIASSSDKSRADLKRPLCSSLDTQGLMGACRRNLFPPSTTFYETSLCFCWCRGWPRICWRFSWGQAFSRWCNVQSCFCTHSGWEPFRSARNGGRGPADWLMSSRH